MIKAIKFVDRYIGNVLCVVIGAFSKFFRRKAEYQSKNILVIQLWGIGETILTLPALHALRLRFPKSKITVVTTQRNRDVYIGNKDIDRIITVGLSPVSILSFMKKHFREFDMAIDMEEYLNISALIGFFVGKYRIGFANQIRSLLYDKKVIYNDQQHVVETYLDLVGSVGAKYENVKLPKLVVTKKDKDYVKKLLKKFKIKKESFIVGIAPGVAESSKSRMWPKERYAKLADKLIEKYNAVIFFVGSKEEAELVSHIQFLMKHKKKTFNFAGKITLRQSFYLIEQCKIFISNDSGLMHVAAAQGVKTIGLFGPNLPLRWKPFGNKNSFVYKPVKCSPCINVHKGQVPECRYGKNNRCMKLITVNDVLEVVDELVG